MNSLTPTENFPYLPASCCEQHQLGQRSDLGQGVLLSELLGEDVVETEDTYVKDIIGDIHKGLAPLLKETVSLDLDI